MLESKKSIERGAAGRGSGSRGCGWGHTVRVRFYAVCAFFPLASKWSRKWLKKMFGKLFDKMVGTRWHTAVYETKRINANQRLIQTDWLRVRVSAIRLVHSGPQRFSLIQWELLQRRADSLTGAVFAYGSDSIRKPEFRFSEWTPCYRDERCACHS